MISVGRNIGTESAKKEADWMGAMSKFFSTASETDSLGEEKSVGVDATNATKEFLSKIDLGKLRIEFLDYKVAIARLNRILIRIRRYLRNNPKDSYLAKIWFAAFLGQRQILKYLNDGKAQCPVAWDQRTGWPSLPSLAADLRNYAEVFKPGAVPGIALQSFSGWTHFLTQEMDCACGRGFKTRKITLEIMLNIIVRVEGKIIKMKLLVGVKSEDHDHLAHHYNHGRLSQRVDDCFIIFESESEIVTKGHFEIRSLPPIKAEQFNTDRFIQLIDKQVIAAA